jgi:hypothetical protein
MNFLGLFRIKCNKCSKFKRELWEKEVYHNQYVDELEKIASKHVGGVLFKTWSDRASYLSRKLFVEKKFFDYKKKKWVKHK